eukprot:Phypoly_transcript_05853.p1 GENE.Phypoly_transcript_05853~~Phypoly_transcript_05853.p1  ORF type:complete len:508 (+),score=72.72 Phypoly_transcript_05853:86-1609(+)
MLAGKKALALNRVLPTILRHHKSTLSISDIPGPTSCFLVGNALDFYDTPNMHNTCLDYAKKYGPIVKFKIGNETSVLVADADMCNQLLVDKKTNYQFRSSFPIIDYTYELFLQEPTDSSKPFDTNTMGGVTFANGPVWARNRKMAGTNLRNPKMFERSIQVMNEQAVLLVENWKKALSESEKNEEKTVVELSAQMSQYAIDVMGHLAYSVDLGALKGQHEKYYDHVKIMLNTINRFLFSPVNFFRYAPLPSLRTYHKSVAYLKGIGDDLVQQRYKEGTGNKVDLLDFLLVESNKLPEDQRLSHAEINSVLMDILGAGHDTTANLFSFSLALLATHPEIQDSVYQEISKIPDNGSGFVQDENVPLLANVFKETLRLYPLGSMFSRTSAEDDKLGDFSIPAQTKLLVPPYILGRLEKYWKDPLKFDPSRFDAPLINKRAWLPFGAGARNCIGAWFGLLEAKILLIHILRTFKLLPDKNLALHTLPESKVSFTLRPKHPLHVVLQPRAQH